MNSMSNFSLQPGGGGPEKRFPGRRRKAAKSVRSGVANMSPLKRRQRKKELQSFRPLHEFARGGTTMSRMAHGVRKADAKKSRKEARDKYKSSLRTRYHGVPIG